MKMLNNINIIKVYAKLLQSCPTLCNPIDGSPSGSAIPGILQARTLEWVAISFSNAWKWKVTVKSLSRVQLSVTPWTTAYQAPPSMGFSRQKYWSGVPLFNINSDLSEGQPGRYRSSDLHHFYTGFYCLLALLLSAGHQDIICLATSNELLRVLFRGKIKFLLRSNKRLQYL